MRASRVTGVFLAYLVVMGCGLPAFASQGRTAGTEYVRIEGQLQRLEDLNEISDLITSLGRELDNQNWGAFTVIFTPDAKAIFPQRTYDGRPAIMAAGASRHGGWLGTEILITDRAIQLKGNRARVRAKFYSINVSGKNAAGEDQLFEVGGRYEFEVVRTPDGWRISRLAERNVWTRGTLPSWLR